MIKLKSIISEILNEMPQITKTGNKVMAGDKELKSVPTKEVDGNIVLIRQPNKNSFFPEGWTLIYFMDSEQSAEALGNGVIPYLLFPHGTFRSGGSPIHDIWKKRFQKPGHEHVLGVLSGNTKEDKIYIDMISVRPGYRRNSIASKMVDAARQKFPNAKVTHSSTTDDGAKFVKTQNFT